MLYEDFYLRIEPLQEGRHPVTVHSSAGDGSGSFLVPFAPKDLSVLQEWFGRGGEVEFPAGAAARDIGSPAGKAGRLRPEEVGGRLFQALFTEQVRGLFEASLGGLPEDGEHGLRLKLCLDPEHPDLAPLCTLPWELLYWEEKREFLSLGRKTQLVRYLNVPRAIKPPLDPPLRILLASACPRDVPALKFETEQQRIETALKKLPNVEVQPLLGATPQSLREKLLEGPFHALHFIGHGSFDSRSGQGALLLEDEGGGRVDLPGRVLANLLRDAAQLRLVFLNACQTARSAREAGLDPFAGLAAALVMAGVPAVLAMRLPVSDSTAIQFSEAFYRRIAAGDPVDAATAEGRMAVHLADSQSLEWATPALFLRSWDGCLFAPVNGLLRASADVRREIIDASRLVRDKTEGFVGRRWVFDDIKGFIREKSRGYFVLRGDPGIGKTSLMAQMVKSEGCAHHFNVRNEGIQRPEQFLRNICAQLITTYGLDISSMPLDVTQSSRFFNSLLDRVAGKLQAEEKAVLLVDALDESDLGPLAPGANALYLPSSLPAGIFVVVTTRFKDLPLRIDCEQGGLDIDQSSPHNLEDIREYIENHLPRPGVRAYLAGQGIDDDTFVTGMVAKSQGNFMYLYHVLPKLERDAYWEFKTLPVGLVSYYEDHWKRMRTRDEDAWFRYQLPVLVALTAVQEPISLGLIARFSGIPDRRRVRAILDEWAQFLYVVQETGEDGRPQKRYRLYHASFFEFIAAKDQVADERINLEETHRRIADELWEEP